MAVIAYKCPHIQVNVVDISERIVKAWNSDVLPIYEPGLDDIVKKVRGKNLTFSTAIEQGIKDADVIFVCVNTPTKVHGIGQGFASNLTNLEKAARTIARVATAPKIVVEKSTVPVQTADAIRRILLAHNKDAKKSDFQVLSNPEFLAEGTAIKDLLSPSRVLIGSEQTPAGIEAAEALVEVYANFVPKKQIITTNLWSSELSKLVANAFLAQRISSINSISALCEKTKANVYEVANAIGSDPRIGSRFLQASVGFGGSCFQKDILNLVYLCKSFGLPEVAEYWAQVVKMNDYQKDRFARNMVKTMFNTVTGKKIALFGFAFKKDTGDTRETAAVYISKSLLDERAVVAVHDPKVTEEKLWEELKYTVGIDKDSFDNLEKYISISTDPYKTAADSHAIAILTEWDSFKELDYQRLFDSMKKPAFLFDGRNLVDHEKLRKIGFQVYAIGKTFKDSLAPMESK